MTNTMPSAGDPAPAFSGPTATGDTLSLGDFSGRWLLLYFYPKDGTPGCTKQACNLRDHFGMLEDEGVAVVGVSADDAASHERFAAKYELPFPLIADPEHAILSAYGAWGEKNFYGKKLVGTKRTSFLIDPEGTVRHVFKRPKTGQHAEEVLEKRDALAS
ncbi:MAG: thioredoxin-dependent thiol peroxidase [Bacteroidota bacterium]